MDEQRPRVMVAGASGYIGGGVLQVLHQRGLWDRVLCRDRSRLLYPNCSNEGKDAVLEIQRVCPYMSLAR